MRGERALGRRHSASGVHGEGPTQGWGGQDTRGAHGEHAAPVRDAGHVEADRLVERVRGLPCRKAGMRSHAMRGEVRVQQRAGRGVRAFGGGGSGMHGESPTQGCGGQGTRGAHEEHGVHDRDTGGVPIGNVRVEILQAIEKVVHVGDGRDVPVGDGAVRCNSGSRVGVVRLDRCLQGGLGREGAGRRGRRRRRRRRRRGRRRRRDDQLTGERAELAGRKPERVHTHHQVKLVDPTRGRTRGKSLA